MREPAEQAFADTTWPERCHSTVHLQFRLLAVLLVVALVLAGIWFTGGVITNDFGVAMWLTAGWMALAGLLCLGVAVPSRALRGPVLGAYAVTAAVAGAYLGSSVALDDVVNEQVAVAARPSAAPAGRSRDERPRNVALRAGRFESVRHPATTSISARSRATRATSNTSSPRGSTSTATRRR